MAQYRGTIKGSRGEASRLGTKSSGLQVSANGWDIGVDVILRYDSQDQSDVVEVYLTGGSNDKKQRRLLGVFDSNHLDLAER